MPGPITYAAVALLARDRLQQIDALLHGKLAHRPAATDLEHQVAYLARQAHQAMALGQPTVAPPARLYGPAQGDAVSKFLFLGAVGPEFTAFGAAYAPLQRWLRDTLHKGTPDQHHEQLLSYSTDFLLAMARQMAPAITRGLTTDAERREALLQLRSCLLGHACHIATDVVTAPYVEALATRLAGPGEPALTRAQVISAIEAEVLALMFATGAPATGHEVDTWWPEPALVPKPFYTAFREALEATYGAGARREGGAPFEAMRAEHAPPELSVALLEDGYRSFRQALGMGHSWSLAQWLGFTSFLYLPALLALPLAAALPMGRDALRDAPPPGFDADAALFESVNLPFALGAAVPLGYTFALTLSPLGAEGPVIFSWVSAAAQLVCAIVFFATLGKGGLPKWLLLFALPLAIELASVVYTLTQVNQDNPRRWLLALAGISHLGLGAIFALLFRAFLHKAPEALNDGRTGDFVLWFLLWLLILGLGLWLPTALLMRYLAAPIPAQPGGKLDSGLVALPAGSTAASLVGRAVVQLVDDSMLANAAVVDDTTSPAARYFPAERRPLLKLWWGAAPAPTVLAQHDRLVFTFGATVRTVFAPALPVRPADLLAYLQAAVQDAAGQALLQGKLYFADQAAFEETLLPAGLLFADHGDDRGTLFEHDANQPTPRPLGTGEADAYVLHTAPRRVLSVAAQRDGPATAANALLRSQRAVGTLTSGAGPAAAVLQVAGVGASPMRAFFRPGDLVEAPFGDPTAPRRSVVSVDNDAQITVNAAFPAALAGVAFGRVQAVAGAGTLTSGAVPSANRIAVAGAVRLHEFLRPGDWVEAPFGVDGAPRRVVVAVDSDLQITVSTPFPAALAAQPWGRVSRPSDRELPPATWQVQAVLFRPNELLGIGTQFGALFKAGDRIEVIQTAAPRVTQLRSVNAVLSDTRLAISAALSGPLAAPVSAAAPAAPVVGFERVADDDAQRYGFHASADDTVFTGQALMNEAADLAALLCMGLTTHLLDDPARDKAQVGGNTSLNRAYQVFRNWNLDHRRVNEWRMLVQGGAVSEKAGHSAASDFAMGPTPPGWAALAPDGEAVANRYGWVPLLRRWLDMAGRGQADANATTAFRPGEASNRALSQGMAFVLDQADLPAPAP